MSIAKKTLILHGWGASDAPHWQAELASTIAKNYGTVSFPILKDFDLPQKDEWVKQVKSILIDFKPDIVICHSLANTLWFWLAQEELQQINNLILVAPPSLNTNIEELKTFFPVKIPNNLYAKNIEMIVSDNDPYITLDEAKEISNSINSKLTIISNGGHLNADSGYGKWEYIENLVNEL